VLESGRDGGKPQPDHGLPNLTFLPLNVVKLITSVEVSLGLPLMRADVCLDKSPEGNDGSPEGEWGTPLVASAILCEGRRTLALRHGEAGLCRVRTSENSVKAKFVSKTFHALR
jgi:hypothetical protein